MVCIAAANGGGTSQDLKTGYIVGATPIYQQLGLIVGVLTSAFVIGMTVKRAAIVGAIYFLVQVALGVVFSMMIGGSTARS